MLNDDAIENDMHNIAYVLITAFSISHTGRSGEGGSGEPPSGSVLLQ